METWLVKLFNLYKSDNLFGKQAELKDGFYGSLEKTGVFVSIAATSLQVIHFFERLHNYK